MKISGDSTKVSRIYDRQNNVSKTEKSTKAKESKDVVSISNSAKDFQTVMTAIKNVPDIREDKVKNIQERIKDDNYNVDTDDLVERMIDSLKDKKI